LAETTTISKKYASNPSLDGLGDFNDYWALLKPRVMSLSIFTALVGLLLAPGSLHPVLAFSAVLFTAVAAGASGALNMWFEATLDALMTRTKNRPIPAGRVEKGAVLGYGLSLAIASVVMMALLLNWLAAGLLAGTIFFYVVVYTMWLKPRTSQNIVIGGLAGALPPLVGWTAVTGSISLEPLVLVAIIFAWTPAHFWAVALLCKKDYQAANLPMLPNVVGNEKTHIQILIYASLTVVLSFTPYVLGFNGVFYAVLAIGAGVMFIAHAFGLFKKKTDEAAKSLFLFSILYLFVIFTSLLADRFLFGGV